MDVHGAGLRTSPPKPQIRGPSRVGKETILKEKQEVDSVSHCLPPQPDLPLPSPVLHLLTDLSVACIVLAAEVKALDILMLLLKQPTTVPGACFMKTMKYTFLSFSFFVEGMSTTCGSCAAPLAGDPGCFFFSFFCSFSQT